MKDEGGILTWNFFDHGLLSIDELVEVEDSPYRALLPYIFKRGSYPKDRIDEVLSAVKKTVLSISWATGVSEKDAIGRLQKSMSEEIQEEADEQ